MKNQPIDRSSTPSLRAMMRRASQPAPDDRLERLRAEVQLMRERNANPSSEHENVKAEIVRQRVPTLDAVLRAINRLIAEQPSARPAPAPRSDAEVAVDRATHNW